MFPLAVIASRSPLTKNKTVTIGEAIYGAVIASRIPLTKNKTVTIVEAIRGAVIASRSPLTKKNSDNRRSNPEMIVHKSMI